MLRQNSNGSDAVYEIRRHLFPGKSFLKDVSENL